MRFDGSMVTAPLVRTLLLCFLVQSVGTTVFAAPTFFVELTTSGAAAEPCHACGGPNMYEPFPFGIPGVVIEHTDTAIHGWGALGGFSYATVSDGAVAVDLLSDIAAGALSRFVDTLFITSSSLPLGTPVELLFHLDFVGAVQAGEPCGVGSAALYGALDVRVGGIGGVVASVRDDKCDSLDDRQLDAVVQVVVGDTVIVDSSLYSELTTGWTFPDPPSAAVSATGRVEFFATPLGNFRYTTASGNSYVAVPEPAGLTILLLGLVCLVVTRSAHRRWVPFRGSRPVRRVKCLAR